MINLDKFKYQSWLDGRIIAINGDCQEVMAEIEDKEIDLVLTIDKFLQRLYYLK